MVDYLDEESAAHFEGLKAILESAGIPYEVNPRLVRGLDYYCHTAFEFTTETLGAQGAVLAGGRYDGLIETMGGPSTPGIGWAGGIERLAMLADDIAAPVRPIALVPVGAEAEARALTLAHELRRAGHVVDLGFGGNLRRRMRRMAQREASRR